MSKIQPIAMTPEWEPFAICTYILQEYAGLTFAEATTYLHTSQFRWGLDNAGRSRQAVYSLRKKAQRKIDACEVPVLDMIRPYVEKAPVVWVD